MVEFRQGFRSMAAPTRELEKLIVSRKSALSSIVRTISSSCVGIIEGDDGLDGGPGLTKPPGPEAVIRRWFPLWCRCSQLLDWTWSIVIAGRIAWGR